MVAQKFAESPNMEKLWLVIRRKNTGDELATQWWITLQVNENAHCLCGGGPQEQDMKKLKKNHSENGSSDSKIIVLELLLSSKHN